MIPHAFAALVEPPMLCGRVIADQRSLYTIETELGTFRALLKGRARHASGDPTESPVVGDYVAILDHGGTVTIECLLPRHNFFARRAVDGSHELQPIAANLDCLFLTIALNRDFNLRRLERYILAAAAFGVPFAIVLTKIDLVLEPEVFLACTRDIACSAPILPVCAVDGRGMSAFAAFRGPERTMAFVGSSGAGKSTLINALIGEKVQDVEAIREKDDRGRHTTTCRSLLRLSDGTAVVDTPGMREFALADASDGIQIAFDDVSEFSKHCRFRDCRHNGEPGCAVRDKVNPERIASWRKLEREAAFLARKSDVTAQAAEKARWKTIHKANRKRDRR